MGNDPQKMLDLIRFLPHEIREATEFQIPDPWPDPPKMVVFCGMGGSGVAGELCRILCESGTVPLWVHKDYGIPAFVDEQTWVVTTSYSGNTEETLSAYQAARERGAKVLAISSGGQLAEWAKRDGVPWIEVPSGFPPRTALGYLFTPLARFLQNAGVMDPEFHWLALADFLESRQAELEKSDSVAKDLADKFYLRIPVFYASRRFFPVAERWRSQINENSKAVAHTAMLPEMNHNEITGLIHPEDLVEELWVVFFAFSQDHDRVQRRIQETQDLIADSVMGTTVFHPQGETLLEQLFDAVYTGDYLSYFLALNYGVDPIAIPRIDELKRRMAR